MAARFADSVDHYSTADIKKKWTQSLGPSVTVSASGRHGNGLLLGQGIVNSTVSITIDYQPTWVAGWAFFDIASSNTPGNPIYSLFANSNAIMSLDLHSDRTLGVRTGGSTYGSTVASLNQGTWFYIEVKNVLSLIGANIAVTTTVKLNGLVVIATMAKDTGIVAANTTNGNQMANRHDFSGSGVLNGTIIDDIYIVDGNGGVNNDFLGDVKIGVIFPASDTATIQFATIVPGAPATHFDKVTDNPPDYDTSYIADATVGHQDNFNWQQISSFTGTIPFVHYVILARKDDENYRSFFPTIGGAQHGVPVFYVNDSYLYYRTCYDTNLDVGGAWTVANFNTETFGAQINS